MNEQEARLTKVKKSCKIAHTIANVVKYIVIAAVCICLVAAVICFIFRSSIDAALAESIRNGSATITFDDAEINGILQFRMEMDALIESGQYGLGIALYCIFGAIVTGCTAVVFHLISRIFAGIEKSESPFSEQVIHSLKTSFIVLVILTGLFHGFDSALFLGLFLWCIYNILEYGAVLQEEVDETL